VIVVVMGVTGAGKTTIGSRLAADLGWPFHEGDGFHPQANVEKMSRGVPLTDEDRRPWLDGLAALIDGLAARGESAVIACSALKESYRRRLRGGHPEVVFVHLDADPLLIAERLGARTGHFAKADLLPSQLATLERPEHAIAVDASGTPEEVAAEIRRRLGLRW
jgi:gluconokinase